MALGVDAQTLLAQWPQPWWLADASLQPRGGNCAGPRSGLLPFQIEAFERRWTEGLSNRRPWTMQLQWRCNGKAGQGPTESWHQLLVQPMNDGLWLGVLTDIAALKAAEAQLHESDALWKLALEATGDGVWDWYIQTGVELYSPGFLRLYGYTQAEIPANPDAFDQLTHPDDREQMARDRQAHFNGLTPMYRNEHRVRCKDGSYKWILTRGMVIARDEAGLPLRMVGTHTDISQQKATEALAWKQANFDPLTGLANRRMLGERLELELKRTRRDGQRLALLALDLDRFKAVNDRLGHDAGDELLLQAGQRILSSVRETDLVARLGGDEFAVLLGELGHDNAVVDRVANALVTQLGQPFELSAGVGEVSVSIGIALSPGDADSAAGLHRCADQALYAVKAQGRQGFRFFTGQLQQAAQARSQLGWELEQALEQQQFRLRYQPIVDADGRCRQAEVLLRWLHPQLGELSPRSFLPSAESAGLMQDLGDWVLSEAATQLKRWRQSLAPQLMLSVNLAGSQLRHWGHSVPDWAARLLRLGVPGSGLMLDVREEQLRDAHIQGLLHLPALRAAGIEVALDDFGADLSALSSLAHEGLTAVKIARDRVLEVRQNQGPGRVWLHSVAQLAQAHGLQVVAKGVDDRSLFPLLRAAGVQAFLGHALAEPMTADAFERWLAASRPDGLGNP